MRAIKDLENLPLSNLFSGPLVAAIDASIQSQTEKVNLLLRTGFDENGDLVTVGFSYETSEINPDTGRERRVAKRIELPLLLFLSLPNLQINQIEQEFSAELTEVEKSERTTSLGAAPFRLHVTPSSKSTTLDRKTKSTYDLDVRMVAELENESTGMEILERAANTALFETVDEDRTERLEAAAGEPTITPERAHEPDAEDEE